ncbi:MULTISPECIES: hypothetical protein [unclassified Nocardioides]|uniref:hypothetical protein n=1 Tax=unclassified Nocardioides TaxID=2615069 RepID=UPI0012E34E94|nr:MULTISPECIES: hypothetical protein [unclassified Nocardioides]
MASPALSLSLEAGPYARWMPRDGRALELLIARLEAVASVGKAQIQSPEYFKESDSGTRREVDVTVRTKAGSADVLVMFECRERAGNQAVDWIDAIDGKRRAIGADVAVAVVGGGGFTEGARNAAAARGIQLRTVEEVSVDDVVSWLGLTELVIHTLEVLHVGFEITPFSTSPRFEDSTLNPLTGIASFPMFKPLFAKCRPNQTNRAADFDLVTADQLHAIAMRKYLEDHEMPKFAVSTPIRLTLSTPQDPAISAKTTDGGLFPLARVIAIGDVRLAVKQVPVEVHSVTDSTGVVTQVVEALDDDGDGATRLTFVRTNDGKITVALHPEAPAVP